MINPEEPKYEGKIEFIGPDFNSKFDATIVHQGMINFKGTVIGEYQLGSERKRTLEIGLEQAFQVKFYRFIFILIIFLNGRKFSRH